MSRLLAFLGGAARGVSSEIEKAEKSAKEEAMLRVKKLSEAYEETRKSNRELTNQLSAEKDWITTTYANATPEQVAYLQSSPAALQALKKMKDPTKISLSDVISIASGNESNAVAAERITAMPEVADKVAAAVNKQYRSGLGGFIDRIGEGAGETAERRFARAMGSDLETMQTTKLMQRPTQAGTFDMAKTIAPDDFSAIKDQAQVELLKAQESNDPKAINAAAEKVARINTIEAMGKVEKKTEAQIQSDLITEIQQKQAANDKQGAATAQALLRQRQILAKAPGDGKKDDDITQSNLIQVATRTRATAIDKELPPGQLITTTDAQGNVTMTLRDLSQGALFRRGDAIAANAIIKEMTKPDGTPRSEKHKNAMMSAGIMFDDAGKAIRPVVPELPTKGGKTTPPPPPPPPAAAPTAAPARGGPTPATPAPAARSTTLPATTRPAVNVGQLRTEANAVIAQGADRAAVAARFKQATGQEL
jgi:hypothetical protein